MSASLEERRFRGMVAIIAEKEFSASTNDDPEGAFAAEIYRQFVAAGKPKNQRAWVKQELTKHFQFVCKPPMWIERSTVPTWPFFQGKPMVFIEQLTVPENEVSRSALAPDVVLYIFGSKKPISDVPGGWDMVYRVIEQVRNL